jgi:hypothetical protein
MGKFPKCYTNPNKIVIPRIVQEAVVGRYKFYGIAGLSITFLQCAKYEGFSRFDYFVSSINIINCFYTYPGYPRYNYPRHISIVDYYKEMDPPKKVRDKLAALQLLHDL